MKKFLSLILFSLSFSLCFSQNVGKYATFAGDDFSADQEGIIWYGSPDETAVISKNFETGKLSVEFTNSSITGNGFGVTFPEYIDLSFNATIQFRLLNLASDSADVVVSISDKNGNILDAVTTPSGQDDALWAVFYGNTDTILSFDFSNAKAGSWQPSPGEFDIQNVSGINFIVNNGAGIYRDIPDFSGTVLIDDFQIGAIPCGTISGGISGPDKICNQSEVSFTVPEEPGALSYRWEVEGDAEVLSGATTDSVRVKAGQADFQITAVAIFDCGDGYKRRQFVIVDESVEPVDGIILTEQYCGFTPSVSFSLTEFDDVSYSWQLPDTLTFAGEATSTLTVDFPNGPASITISGSASNTCGIREFKQYEISLTEGSIKPKLEYQDDHLYVDSIPENITIKWYRYGMEIPNETGESIVVSETGGYAVEFDNGICAVRSDEFFVKYSDINGIGPTYARDDFSSTNGYINSNTDGFLVWWFGSTYQEERKGDGKMKVTSAGNQFFDYFGVNFESTEGGIDLSTDANVHFIVENTSDQDLNISITLTDIDGRYTNILNDTSNGLQYAIASIPAKTTKIIDIDFTGTFATEYVNCSSTCPNITDDFDFRSVTQVQFIFNIEASFQPDAEPFTGSVYFKDFLIGNYIWQDGDSLATVNASNIQWEKDGEELPGANSQKIAIAGSGEYSVKLTDTDNSLHVSRLKTVNDVLGSTISTESNSIRIYPNPSSGLVTISAKDKIEKVEISDLSGKLLLTGSDASINTEGLEPGIYMVSIHAGGQVYTKRLIRQ